MLVSGLDYSMDPILIAETASPNLACVRFDRGMVKKDVGRRLFSNEVSQYPSAHSANYVKATSNVALYDPFNATDPSKSLVGAAQGNAWAANANASQRFHIDLGSPEIIGRVYYENYHAAGIALDIGAKALTLWGSNDANAFADLTYANDANWTQITGLSANELSQHANANLPDPKYITIANANTPYRYYSFKFANNHGNSAFLGVRRIALQTANHLDDYLMHIDSFPTYLGTTYTLFNTPKWTYSLQSDGSFKVLNTVPFTGAANNNFYTTVALDANGQDLFLITNGIDPIYKWDASNFALLGGMANAVGTIQLGAGGANYVANEILTIQQANSANNATARVDSVANGVVTGVTLLNRGANYAAANGLATTASANGSNCTLNILATGGSLRGKYIIPFKSRLILAQCTEDGFANPTRVRWSVAGDIEDYIGAGSGFVDLSETPDWILGLCLFKGRLLVFKESSIWELVYVGGTTVFTPALLVATVGATTGQSILALRDKVVFLSTDGVYTYDLYNLKTISDLIYQLLYPTETRIFNLSKVYCTRVAYIEELDELWMSIPTVGEIPDTVLKYNFLYKSWVKRPQEVTAFGYYQVESGGAWKDQTATWENYVGDWVSRVLASGAPTTLMGDSLGYVYEDDRLTTSGDTFNFETKDWILPVEGTRLAAGMRIVEVHIEARGGPFFASYSMDGGATWSTPHEFLYSAVFSECVLYMNEVTQMVRVRITSTATQLDIRWIEPWVLERKRALSIVT
jgi:hypothetical protein